MKRRSKVASQRVFRPRFRPRNKYDWRLIATLYPLAFAVLLPIAVLWMFVPTELMMRMTNDAVLALLVFVVQWMLWMGCAVTPMLNRLEVDEQGIQLPGVFKTLVIDWGDIESIGVATIGEVVKATLRWPFRDPSLRFSNSPFTYSQYIRIRHTRGTVYFAAEETEELLALLLERRHTPVGPTAWYQATTPVVAESPAPLLVRRR